MSTDSHTHLKEMDAHKQVCAKQNAHTSQIPHSCTSAFPLPALKSVDSHLSPRSCILLLLPSWLAGHQSGKMCLPWFLLQTKCFIKRNSVPGQMWGSDGFNFTHVWAQWMWAWGLALLRISSVFVSCSSSGAQPLKASDQSHWPISNCDHNVSLIGPFVNWLPSVIHC